MPAVNSFTSSRQLGDYEDVEGCQNGMVILKDELLLYGKSSPRFKISVTRKNISCLAFVEGRENSKKSFKLNFCDIIGSDCMKGRNHTDSNAYVAIYAYPHKKKFVGKKTTRQRHCITLQIDKSSQFEENLKIADQWRLVILHLSQNHYMEPKDIPHLKQPNARKLLVLVNPFGGPGKALTNFQEKVVPMFAEAGVHFNMVVTERQNHAREMMRSIKLSDWSGIVTVSGDGLIFEVVNGLMEREDWEEAIKIPLGPLPGGSGNALCCAINFARGEPFAEEHILHSTFAITKPDIVPMDLIAIETRKEQLFSFLSTGWGILSDVDIESEKYRSLGTVRFTIGTLARIFGLRRYRGRLSFLPVDEYPPMKGPRSSGLKHSQSECIDFNTEAKNNQGRNGFRSHSVGDLKHVVNGKLDEEHVTETSERRTSTDENGFSAGDGSWELIKAGPEPEKENVLGQNGACGGSGAGTYSGTENGSRSFKKPIIPTPLLNPLDQPVPDNWVTIEDEFILVGGITQTHLNKDIFAAPEARLNDGVIYLGFVRASISRKRLLMLIMAMENGEHVNNPDMDFIKVRAFRLEPLTDKGILTVDGEEIDYGPIQAQVLPSIARIMLLRK